MSDVIAPEVLQTIPREERIRLLKLERDWRWAQLAKVQAKLASMDPEHEPWKAFIPRQPFVERGMGQCEI
jgi:hypothetical protein